MLLWLPGDKDFMQLITHRAVIWDPMKEKTLDLDTVTDKYGIEPTRLIDVMGLWGDASDNIPGVPGIGEKTALSLIKKFDSMENLYNHLDQITQHKLKENLLQFKDQAFLSKKLVTIDTNVPFPFDPDRFKLQSPDTKKLSHLFKELEFRQLQQEFPENTDTTQKVYLPVLTAAELDDLVQLLESQTRFALDTETTSEDPMKAELVGLSFSVKPDEAFYIPVAHDYENAPRQLNISAVLKKLKPVLKNPKIKKIGQNIKYDWMVLLRHGVHLAGVAFDTMLASYLINPSKRTHGLDQIALDLFGYKTIGFGDLVGKGKGASVFNEVVLEKAVPYACEDADLTLAAQHVLKSNLEEIGLLHLFETVEIAPRSRVDANGNAGNLREFGQTETVVPSF